MCPQRGFYPGVCSAPDPCPDPALASLGRSWHVVSRSRSSTEIVFPAKSRSEWPHTHSSPIHGAWASSQPFNQHRPPAPGSPSRWSSPSRRHRPGIPTGSTPAPVIRGDGCCTARLPALHRQATKSLGSLGSRLAEGRCWPEGGARGARGSRTKGTDAWTPGSGTGKIHDDGHGHGHAHTCAHAQGTPTPMLIPIPIPIPASQAGRQSRPETWGLAAKSLDQSQVNVTRWFARR